MMLQYIPESCTRMDGLLVKRYNTKACRTYLLSTDYKILYIIWIFGSLLCCMRVPLFRHYFLLFLLQSDLWTSCRSGYIQTTMVSDSTQHMLRPFLEPFTIFTHIPLYSNKITYMGLNKKRARRTVTSIFIQYMLFVGSLLFYLLPLFVLLMSLL